MPGIHARRSSKSEFPLLSGSSYATGDSEKCMITYGRAVSLTSAGRDNCTRIRIAGLGDIHNIVAATSVPSVLSVYKTLADWCRHLQLRCAWTRIQSESYRLGWDRKFHSRSHPAVYARVCGAAHTIDLEGIRKKHNTERSRQNHS